MRAPSPRAATTGSPPTPRNARTGEFTPPGKSARARANTSAERILTCSDAGVTRPMKTSAAVASDRHLTHWELTRNTPPLRNSGGKRDPDYGSQEVVVIDDF